MLEDLGSIKQHVQATKKVSGEPKVGVFWVHDGRLLMDATPVSEASSYGDFKIHDRGHYTFWPKLQRKGLVPTELEYDEVPRGRVGYNTKREKVLPFADACIQKNEPMVDRLKGALHLPANTVVQEDSHYKCPGCMKQPEDQEGPGIKL